MFFRFHLEGSAGTMHCLPSAEVMQELAGGWQESPEAAEPPELSSPHTAAPGALLAPAASLPGTASTSPHHLILKINCLQV